MAQPERLIELFNQRVFRIPDYQRGYAWEEKQLSELWDDLDEISEQNGELKQHYTGTIFLEEIEPMPEEKWLSNKFYNIVDGQQRLTTIVILVFEMLKMTDSGYCERRKDELFEIFIAKKNLSETNKVYKFRYLDTNENNSYLLKIILENQKEVLRTNNHNLYTENLRNAKEFFSKKITELSIEQKERLFQKIIFSLLFDIRIIEKKTLDVQAVFETMNNRGKPLTTLEKLKNRLIYLNDKFIDGESGKKILRDKINASWGEIYRSLAQDPDPLNILDEDIFLSAHLSLYKEPQEGYVFSEKSAEEKVFQMFCNKPEKYKEEPITYQKIEKYIISLADLAPIWYEVHHSNNDMVKKILLINRSKEVKILLAALLIKNPNRQNLESIFHLIEKAFFRNSVPGMSIMNIEYDAATRARDIYDGGELTELTGYLDGKLKLPIDPQVVVNGFRWLFSYERGNKGFHRWGGIKYFLFAYEENLRIEFDEQNDKVSLLDYYQTQVEHIMPQTYWDFWNTEMEDFIDTIDEDKHNHAAKVLLNTLGNLTILGSKNQEVKNYPWSYKQNRFCTGSYNEIEISKFEHWDHNTIKTRGEKMLKFLCEKVDVQFDETTKRQILFDADSIIKRVYE